jgi:hypothetical protein
LRLDANIFRGREKWLKKLASDPGLPDGLFSNQKIPNLGKFWSAFEW